MQIDPADLAQLQQKALADLLGAERRESGGASARLPDLHFAEREGTILLSSEHLAPGVDVDALPEPIRLIQPVEARLAADKAAAATAGGYLEFRPPVFEGDLLTLGLAVHAFAPGGAKAMPISTLSLAFERRGDEWVPAGPPAALSA